MISLGRNGKMKLRAARRQVHGLPASAAAVAAQRGRDEKPVGWAALPRAAVARPGHDPDIDLNRERFSDSLAKPRISA
jgi:hypothetical protein